MTGLCLGIVALSALIGPKPSVVYDNTETFAHTGMPLLTDLRTFSAEMGDEVHLAGSERVVVQLKLRFWYAGTKPGTFDARIRFRNLDPSKPTPGPAVFKDGKVAGYVNTASPTAPFYEGGLVEGLKATAGMNEYTFKIPDVEVPDRFVWTIECTNKKGIVGNLGPAYYNPPTVGQSDDFFWHSDMKSPWIAYSWGGSPYCNFGARILAIAGKAPG